MAELAQLLRRLEESGGVELDESEGIGRHGSGMVTPAGTLTAVEHERLSVVWSAGEGDRPALISPDDGLTVNRTELPERVDSLARDLAGVGVARGDRVAFALPNGPELVELLFAISAVGAAAAPLNPAYTSDEFSFYLGDLAPRLLLLPEGEAAAARAAAGNGLEVRDVVLGGGRTTVRSANSPSAYEPG